MNNSGSLLNTPTNGDSTIRPRVRRLISVEDDDDTERSLGASFGPSSNLPSPFPSRGVSPIPKSHPSRVQSNSLQSAELNGNKRGERSGQKSSRQLSSSVTAGIWGASWSSIQGLASNVLGSDAGSGRGVKLGAVFSGSSTRKKGSKSAVHRRAISGAAASEWGPAVDTSVQIAAGSKEARQAYVQAKKREALLLAATQEHLDHNRRFKRRDSDERITQSVPPAEEQDRDALVYVHQVKSGDTLAGVMIRYGCQPPVFRKVNRFWPNDSIQIRKIVLLPVEACSVRGKKIPAPEEMDLLASDISDRHTIHVGDALRTSWRGPESASRGSETPRSIATEFPEEPLWKHESWVKIDNIPEAVEIGRISRRTLGFFPPSRRKSLSYSDLDTPSTSLDLPRLSVLNTSPSRPSRVRSSSGSYFANHLRGPGGVGTLDKTATSPGPSLDSLNRILGPHLPNVAPRSSFESTRSNSSSGIDNVGGAIEGWVRKMATKAATIIEQPPSGQSGMGDLIELDVAPTDEFNDNGTPASLGNETGVGKGTSRHGQEALLRERFPPRGRIFGDEAIRKKGD